MDMESSASATPKQHGQNPDDVFERIVQSLQDLELFDAIDDDIKLSCTIMNQPSSLQTQRKSGSDNESMWGYRFFTYGGGVEKSKIVVLKQAKALFHICIIVTNPTTIL
ncbi:hypothetical protein OROMI_026638 [Orobanche minor]